MWVSTKFSICFFFCENTAACLALLPVLQHHVCGTLEYDEVPGRCEVRDAGVSASLGDSTVFLVDFLLLALSYEKLEETG